jgi:hypothetical protein
MKATLQISGFASYLATYIKNPNNPTHFCAIKFFGDSLSLEQAFSSSYVTINEVAYYCDTLSSYFKREICGINKRKL